METVAVSNKLLTILGDRATYGENLIQPNTQNSGGVWVSSISMLIAMSNPIFVPNSCHV
jgi:hypothetical protein